MSAIKVQTESELATKLRITVERTLQEVSERAPAALEQNDKMRNWLRECQQAILDGNHFRYRETLSGLVRAVLANLHSDLVQTKELGLTEVGIDAPEPPGPHIVLLSFHVSSVQLRKWFRVLEPRTAWSRTDYRGSEISFFNNIYDWDTRYGHILTDPGMPRAIDGTFGSQNEQLPEWDGRNPFLAFRIKSSTDGEGLWDKAHHLVTSRVFTVLVDHELDKCDNVQQVKDTLANFHHFRQGEIDDFALRLNLLGTAVRGLWPKTSIPTMAVMARSFLLSFFYTVGRPRTNCERIVTSSIMPACSKFNGTRLVKTGSLAVVVAGQDADAIQKLRLSHADIQPAATALAHAVVELEHRAIFERLHDDIVSITEEDSIRQACEVDYLSETATADREPTWDQILKLSRPLHEAIAYSLIEAHYPKDTDRAEVSKHHEKCNETRAGSPVMLPEELKKDLTIQRLLEKCDIVGASRQYVQLVRDLAAAAATDDLSETRVVFLDSEPGCGKEMLAKLLHLFSLRAHLDAHATRFVSGEDGKLQHVLKIRTQDVFGDESKKHLDRLICQDHEKFSVFEALSMFLATGPKEDYQKARLSNYFTLNMAALTDGKRFLAELFGSYDKNELVSAGCCLMAHALCGTVFLDELNTLPTKDQANSFLRLLEKPFEMEILGRPAGPMRDSNMFIVFASNNTRQELIEAGFNEAVVYRVTKTRIRIPPLRERPADIAVFVNARVRKHNEKRCKAEKKKEQIRKIDIQAMRLLCELRWPDNYRGVQGLMDDVLGDRIQRGIEHLELTFDEILHGLRRREAFHTAVSRGNTPCPWKMTYNVQG